MTQNAKTTHAAVTDAEPSAGTASMPIWLLVTLLVLCFGGGLYFDAYGGWFNQQVYPPYRSLNQLTQFQPASGADRMMARGKVVYEQVCALCHGTDGMGKPGQAPPFAGSDWVTTDSIGRLIRIPLQGLSGPITVKGEAWNLAMPAMGAALSDDDLAAVLTYMRNAWGNKASEIAPEQVKEVRDATVSRLQPWTSAELESVQ